MLIRCAEIGGALCDVRLRAGRIAELRPGLGVRPQEDVVEAAGGALLPGLIDHHIHLNAAAAAFASIRCGPPDVGTPEALAAALHAAPGEGWVRGIGYHPAVGVELDRTWLDRHGPARPVRIQHRSGRMWIFNSRAAAELGEAVPGDGRMIDGDAKLRGRLRNAPPDLAPVGAALARFGVTGLTEATARNGLADYERLARAGLAQRLLVMGGPELDEAGPLGRARRGPVKLHYHDHALPDLDELTREIARAHEKGRPVAAHCVTRAELVLILAAIAAAGPDPGDRIEHGAVIDPDAAEWIAALGLTVVSQPHFLVERGPEYRVDVAAEDRPFLYRLGGLKAAGIAIAAGSDAPFGGLDPWRSMAAAIDRPAGFGDGGIEPEAALALFTGTADAPGGGARKVEIGAIADLCLIDRPWHAARRSLASVVVRATWIGGELAYASMASTSPQASAVEAGSRFIDKAR
jgi:predicted amidohydrolase YtcJ